MAKKIILIFLGIVILAVGGLTIYVSNIDWNAHKQEIADKFSQITGKKIEFAGEVSVSVFPQPTLTASNINIYNPQNQTQKLVSIDHLDTRVSLPSLLKGAPDVRSLSIIGAEVWIDVNEKDELNWRSYNSMPGLSEGEANTRLQSLNIQNALIHYDNRQMGISFDMSQFNADIQAESLQGPYRLDGNFMKDSDHFGLAVSVGSFSGLADVAVNFAITHPKSESFLRFDGTYMPNEGGIKGDFSGGSKLTADFVNILFGSQMLEESYNEPLQFSLGIEADNEKVDLSSFVIKYSNFIEGSGSVNIPLRQPDRDKLRTTEIKYQLINLDLRPIIAFLKAEYEIYKANGKVYQPDSRMNIVADISAERITLNDGDFGYFENMSLKGGWVDNVLSLEEFYAASPGNIVLNLTGSLVEENNAPQYFVRVAMEGKDFQTFLQGLGVNITAPVSGTYRNIDLSFSMYGGNDVMSVNDVKLNMDNMKIEAAGGIQYEQGKPTYDFQVTADSVNVDNYVPKKDDVVGGIANFKDYLTRLGMLKWYNMNGKINIKNMLFRGAQMKNLAVDFSSRDGEVSVKNLSAEKVLESKFAVSGNIKNIGELDVVFENMKYNIESQNFASVISSLSLPLPNWKIFNAKNFNANGGYSGNFLEGNVELETSADDVKFNYKGMVKTDEKFAFDGGVLLKTINFSELVNNIGGKMSVNANTRGAFNCTGLVKGDTTKWQFANADCMLGIAKYNGILDIEKNNNNYRIAGIVNVDDFNIENVIDAQTTKGVTSSALRRDNEFLARPEFSKDVFVFDLYRNLFVDIGLSAEKAVYKNKTLNNLRLRILNADNVLKLENFSFVTNGIEAAGNLQVNYIQDPVVKGNINLDKINLQSIGGNVYGFISGEGNLKGEFEAPATSVDELMKNISGNFDFAVNNLTVKGMDFAKIRNDVTERKYSKGLFQQVRDNLQSGRTMFDVLQGKINASAGVLKLENAVMQNPEVKIDLSGTFNLNDWKMNTTFDTTLLNAEEIPPFSFTLSGMMNKPVLDINIEKIVAKYDTHWAQVEADEQAKKAKEEQLLSEKMAKAQEVVAETSEKVNALIPTIDEYLQSSRNDNVVEWYKIQLDALNEMNKSLDKMQGQAHIPGYTQEDTTQIEQLCRQYQQQVETININTQKQYEVDVTDRLTKTIEQIQQSEEKYRRMSTDYQQLLQDKFDELLKVEASQFMVGNPKLQELQDQMSQQNKLLQDRELEFEEKFEQLRKIAGMAELESKLEELFKEQQVLEQQQQELENIYNQTETMLNEIVREQIKVFAQKQAEKEARRKALEKENLGNLLFENNQSSTAVSSAATAEKTKAPVAASDGKSADNITSVPSANEGKSVLRRVDDEIKYNSSTVSGTIKKSYEDNTPDPVAAPRGNLLREADGAIRKPTGTIIVK